VQLVVWGHDWKFSKQNVTVAFDNLKIKTEKGMSVIALANNTQVEVGQRSVVSIDDPDRLHLTQGSVSFRIPAAVETNIKTGALSIMKSRSLQAAKDSSIASGKDEGIIGAVTLHSDGSVTVKSEQGNLSVVNQEHRVVASLSSNESVTIPSPVASGKESIKVAQAGAGTGGAAGGETSFLGLSGLGLVGAGAGLAGIATLGVLAADDDSEKAEPVCP